MSGVSTGPCPSCGSVNVSGVDPTGSTVDGVVRPVAQCADCRGFYSLVPTRPAGEAAAYADSVRAEITRHGGDLPTAIGIVIGAASMCWEHPAGAGIFQSQYAAALIDVLLEYVAAAACACNTTEQRTHPRGDQAFCRQTYLDRVSRSEIDD